MQRPVLKKRIFRTIQVFASFWVISFLGDPGIAHALSQPPNPLDSFPAFTVVLALFGLGILGCYLLIWQTRRVYASTFSGMPGLVFRIGKSGKIEFASRHGLDWIGASISDNLRDHILDHDALLDLRREALEAKGDIRVAELQITTRQGDQRWLRVQSAATHPGKADGPIDCIAWDITELVNERNLRRESEDRLAVLETLSNEALFLHDGGQCVDLNSAAERMFGYHRDELLHMNAADIIANATLPLVMANIRSGYDKPYEAIAKRKDGTEFYCEINGRNVQLGDKTLRLTSFTDITDRKISEDEIRFQANHDALTSLPNRYLFMDRLTYAIQLAKRRRECFALLFIDIDGFKTLNDTYGHSVGDKILSAIADRLTQTLRNVDTVARLGGDEFTIILPGTETPEDAEIVARKLQAALTSTPIEIDGDHPPMMVAASIGIALYPDHGDTKDTLLSAADDAMYAAKKSGRNAYMFATTKR